MAHWEIPLANEQCDTDEVTATGHGEAAELGALNIFLPSLAPLHTHLSPLDFDP